MKGPSPRDSGTASWDERQRGEGQLKANCQHAAAQITLEEGGGKGLVIHPSIEKKEEANCKTSKTLLACISCLPLRC